MSPVSSYFDCDLVKALWLAIMDIRRVFFFLQSLMHASLTSNVLPASQFLISSATCTIFNFSHAVKKHMKS